MLQLKNITKDYVTASETVQALKGVSLSFRKKEFVSILGPSGCGKTTLLNIIGGLDHYTSGDLIIRGRSTESYKDRDWDVYRNHRIGFIFQSYNLIPHQTVLGNVELALTISGVSREERVERAKRALDRVGLSGQYYKRPNQLSGGQCQRVAIARALVNDPEILLADEPTGALDTVTSKQIMDLIKEISGERLVIMVTHNPEIAEEYSTRIIRLVDGCVTEDTNPFSEEDEAAESEAIIAAEEKELQDAVAAVESESEKKKIIKKQKEKAKMSFFTAFMLSLKNLFTKKGRTTLTAFAGSIGIIGIALILAVSQGMTTYINHVQETTLSTYPLTLESTAVDASELINSILGADQSEPNHENDAVYKDPLIAELVTALSKIEANENDLAAFKVHIENQLKNPESELSLALSGIQYSYNINVPIYTLNGDGNIIKSDTNDLMRDMLTEFMIGMATKGESLGTSGTTMGQGTSSSAMSGMMMGGVQMWEELLSGLPDAEGNRELVNPILKDQYTVVDGRWPESKEEVVLVLNERNELDDLTLYALGLLSEADLDAIIDAAVHKMPMPETTTRWEYSDILNLTFKAIMPYHFYQKVDNEGEKPLYADFSTNEAILKMLYKEKALSLKVVGIIKPDEESEAAMLKGSIVYTYALTEYIIREAVSSDVVAAQLANPDIDVLTGLPFKSASGKLTDAEKRVEFDKYVASLTDEEKIGVYVDIQCLKAIDANLESYVEMAFAQFPTEEALKTAVLNALKESASVNEETLSSYINGLTEAELKEMMRPAIEEQVKNTIRDSTKRLLDTMPAEAKLAGLTAELSKAADSDYAKYYNEITEFSTSTYEEVIEKIGYVDLESPDKINLYASTFANKDVITGAIDSYNASVPREKQIAYTDLLGIMMSSITTIIDAITYVLIAFVAISLVVSSIMIGVITLISVQERTKEIGVLRAIGASKRDVSSMFNAETIIIGLCAGLLGVTVTYLLCIPINLILNALTGLPNLEAILPISAAGILVLISVTLTLISGLIPASSAAKKDPVVALRTE